MVFRWNIRIKKIFYVLFLLIFFFPAKKNVYAAEPVIVVLDAGHGGENLGGEYKQYTEKDMTIIVAEAMKEELEKYEGITVYMTREADTDMTLEDRVDFAVSVNADFIFCLHFNMSVKHDYFGAEVWVSAFGEEYRQGYTFAHVEMDMLKELGLYERGIKTKFNSSGTDYYGIIRLAAEKNIPSALIEHCHLDQKNDQNFYDSKEKLKSFGVLDATAVAKYYGLESEILGVDYSAYKNVEMPLPDSPVRPDNTPPDICFIEAGEVNDETGDISVTLSARDYDSPMLYYNYSYDGGKTYSDLQKWETGGTDSLSFTMNVPSEIVPDIVVNAYNGFDGFTESNHIFLPSMSYGEEETEEKITDTKGDIPAEEKKEVSYDTKRKAPLEKEPDIRYFLQIGLICSGILFVLIVFVNTVFHIRHSKKKRRRRK